MTETFKAIIEQKKDSLKKITDGLQELVGQPSLTFPPDPLLRKCSSAELVCLIALDAEIRALSAATQVVMNALYNMNSRWETTRETLLTLGKCDDSKGGASFGW